MNKTKQNKTIKKTETKQEAFPFPQWISKHSLHTCFIFPKENHMQGF